MSKVVKKYMAIGARVRVVRTNPMLKAEIGDEGVVLYGPSIPGWWWQVLFDDGHREAVSVRWVEVLESTNTWELNLTPLPAFLPRPEPLRPRRRYRLDYALTDLRRWLRDIEAGQWPERLHRRIWNTGPPFYGMEKVTHQVEPDRPLASRQAKILRRMVNESNASQSRWYDEHPPDHDFL